jgi:hypothetical protein
MNQKMKFLFVIQLIVFFITLNILLLNPIQDALADGLFEENLPPASVGDREASCCTCIDR